MKSSPLFFAVSSKISSCRKLFVTQSWRNYSSAAQQPHDLIVIGGGPGGYVAAIKASQLGLKTACIEKRGSLGGTCLNVGCIPSKALLHASQIYYDATHSNFSKWGIQMSPVNLDFPSMQQQKDKSVKNLTSGIEFLFKKYQVDYFKGEGTILGNDQVLFKSNQTDSEQLLSTKNILIATGSESSQLPFLPFDEKFVLSSTGALSLQHIPKRMIVIGAGVIGLELGSVFNRLGSQVTVLESNTERISPFLDREVSHTLKKILEKQGMTFKLGISVTNGHVDTLNKKVMLELESNAKGSTKAKEQIEADVVLVCIGRRPYTQRLGLENVGISLDEKGRIPVNDHLQTSSPSIYAIGDVVRGPMLAHKAEHEGFSVAEYLAGRSIPHLNYNAIPNVIYTHPEVASIGQTEQDLLTNSIPYRVGKFPFVGNARSKTIGEGMEGFVKVLTDAVTDRILGVHIIGMYAGELIAEAALALEYGASAEDIARTCHAHPTFAEAFKEAALMAYDGKPLNI
ncbi:hypothetical protein C9374_011175 [Naegleria lovaniensis]|uniref:Dihydrolipoyl dehydrogenase n=1 Tax=Naegleria lovaniensis TaxID=51637 RepID=A0AA88GCQ4_NAELO|nr:uncharacterized protein C9374_011175 [Naegleria lovaniensis]KAG2374096.1 hypothetical protein C9374_011175 [Naegleria lovaniensis]